MGGCASTEKGLGHPETGSPGPARRVCPRPATTGSLVSPGSPPPVTPATSAGFLCAPLPQIQKQVPESASGLHLAGLGLPFRGGVVWGLSHGTVTPLSLPRAGHLALGFHQVSVSPAGSGGEAGSGGPEAPARFAPGLHPPLPIRRCLQGLQRGRVTLVSVVASLAEHTGALELSTGPQAPAPEPRAVGFLSPPRPRS